MSADQPITFIPVECLGVPQGVGGIRRPIQPQTGVIVKYDCNGKIVGVDGCFQYQDGKCMEPGSTHRQLAPNCKYKPPAVPSAEFSTTEVVPIIGQPSDDLLAELGEIGPGHGINFLHADVEAFNLTPEQWLAKTVNPDVLEKFIVDRFQTISEKIVGFCPTTPDWAKRATERRASYERKYKTKTWIGAFIEVRTDKSGDRIIDVERSIGGALLRENCEFKYKCNKDGTPTSLQVEFPKDEEGDSSTYLERTRMSMDFDTHGLSAIRLEIGSSTGKFLSAQRVLEAHGVKDSELAKMLAKHYPTPTKEWTGERVTVLIDLRNLKFHLAKTLSIPHEYNEHFNYDLEFGPGCRKFVTAIDINGNEGVAVQTIIAIVEDIIKLIPAARTVTAEQTATIIE